MIRRVRAFAMLLSLAGCIPDFDLDNQMFISDDAASGEEDAGDPDPDPDGSDGGEEPDVGAHPDASKRDADPRDADRRDTDPLDADPLDTDLLDAGPIDSGPIDGGPIDSGPIDSGPIDSGPIDTGSIDTRPIDAGPDCVSDCSPPACNGFFPDAGNWQCISGEKVEAACENGLDDDGDGEKDCNDTSDCGCGLGPLGLPLICCPNGNCLELANLCGG